MEDRKDRESFLSVKTGIQSYSNKTENPAPGTRALYLAPTLCKSITYYRSCDEKPTTWSAERRAQKLLQIYKIQAFTLYVILCRTRTSSILCFISKCCMLQLSCSTAVWIEDLKPEPQILCFCQSCPSHCIIPSFSRAELFQKSV